VPINFLVHQATLAVKEGMTREDALRSLTVNPAQMMGLADHVGALQAGLDGDVVIWDGDPLDVMSRAVQTFVSGVSVYEWRDGAGVTTRAYRS
jgi:imidazolonepropionase-like amidohydrolase